MIVLPTIPQAIRALEVEMRRPREREGMERLPHTTQGLRMAADAIDQVGWQVHANKGSAAILRYLGAHEDADLIFTSNVRWAFEDGINALRRINQ